MIILLLRDIPLGSAFSAAKKKIPKKKKKKRQVLGDIDILEVDEDVCTKKGFEQYSVQEFDGQVVLKRPAFPDRPTELAQLAT